MCRASNDGSSDYYSGPYRSIIIRNQQPVRIENSLEWAENHRGGKLFSRRGWVLSILYREYTDSLAWPSLVHPLGENAKWKNSNRRGGKNTYIYREGPSPLERIRFTISPPQIANWLGLERGLEFRATRPSRQPVTSRPAGIFNPPFLHRF